MFFEHSYNNPFRCFYSFTSAWRKNKKSQIKVMFKKNFYVPQAWKLVFPLQLRVTECCLNCACVYQNPLLLHMIDKIKMARTSRDLSTVMTSAANN